MDFAPPPQQCIVIDCQYSTLTNVTSGVPRGVGLSPLLFLIYNDLPNSITSKIKHFVDECVLYNKITQEDDMINLQDDFTNINNCGSTWQMQLNHYKCKLVTFTRKKSQLSHQYTINGNALCTASS